MKQLMQQTSTWLRKVFETMSSFAIETINTCNIFFQHSQHQRNTYATLEKNLAYPKFIAAFFTCECITKMKFICTISNTLCNNDFFHTKNSPLPSRARHPKLADDVTNRTCIEADPTTLDPSPWSHVFPKLGGHKHLGIGGLSMESMASGA
jgi:hypothetical protein